MLIFIKIHIFNNEMFMISLRLYASAQRYWKQKKKIKKKSSKYLAIH